MSFEALQARADQVSRVLKLIDNPYRLMVLCLLAKHQEMAVMAMLDEIPVSQSALSQHLAKMRHDGIVQYRREAQTLYYSIANQDVAELMGALKTIFCDRNDMACVEDENAAS